MIGRGVGGAVAALLVGWFLGVSPAALAAPDQSGAPWATADTQVSQLGGLVHIQGAGWGAASGDTVAVVLCGNAALDGSSDCAVDNVAEGAVGVDGQFITAFRLLAPPYPCPCVLRVNTPSIDMSITIPITVAGVPSVPPTKQVHVRRAVTVDQVHLEGSGPWLAWFGGNPRRSLVYRVTNSGDVMLHSPTAELSWGRGMSPSGFIQAPDVGDLAPQQSKTFRVPLSLPALSIGSYGAVVRVDPLGSIGTERTSLFAMPYGLVVLAGIGLLVVVNRWLHRRRRVQEILGAAGVAGWYLDPLDGEELRLWNGRSWTNQVRAILPGFGDPDAAGHPPHEPQEVSQESLAEPGWYADPTADDRLRLWDGADWTEETRPRETASARAD